MYDRPVTAGTAETVRAVRRVRAARHRRHGDGPSRRDARDRRLHATGRAQADAAARRGERRPRAVVRARGAAREPPAPRERRADLRPRARSTTSTSSRWSWSPGRNLRQICASTARRSNAPMPVPIVARHPQPDLRRARLRAQPVRRDAASRSASSTATCRRRTSSCPSSGVVKLIDFGIAKASRGRHADDERHAQGQVRLHGARVHRRLDRRARRSVRARRDRARAAHEPSAVPRQATTSTRSTACASMVDRAAVAKNPRCPPEIDDIVMTALAARPRAPLAARDRAAQRADDDDDSGSGSRVEHARSSSGSTGRSYGPRSPPDRRSRSARAITGERRPASARTRARQSRDADRRRGPARRSASRTTLRPHEPTPPPTGDDARSIVAAPQRRSRRCAAARRSAPRDAGRRRPQRVDDPRPDAAPLDASRRRFARGQRPEADRAAAVPRLAGSSRSAPTPVAERRRAIEDRRRTQMMTPNVAARADAAGRRTAADADVASHGVSRPSACPSLPLPDRRPALAVPATGPASPRRAADMRRWPPLLVLAAATAAVVYFVLPS